MRGKSNGQFDFVFFFQAEDGIRDLTVTGVQTCALPIYFISENAVITGDYRGIQDLDIELNGPTGPGQLVITRRPGLPFTGGRLLTLRIEIGRASCRERV